MEKNTPVNNTKLENTFPSNFFDGMEKLLIHFVQEAHLGDPIQTWMYPFEQ